MRKGMGVLIFGRGWIGSRLKELMSQDRWVGEVRLSVLDITDEPVLEDEIINFRPDAIINAAGFTGGKEGIDYCDKDKVGAYRSNVLGVSVLADICAQRGIYLVHLSTADVFNGHRYYAGQYFDENFRPKTVGYYAETKLAGESVLMASPAQFCILRLNMPFDEKPHPRNLITKIVKSGQLNGGLHSITHLGSLAEFIPYFIKDRACGIWNVACPSPIHLVGIATRYEDMIDATFNWTILPSIKFGSHRALDLPTDKLAAFLQNHGVVMEDTGVCLDECLMEYAKELEKGNPV